MGRQQQRGKTILVWSAATAMVVLYPPFVALFMKLPLWLGIAGYGLLAGMHRRRMAVALVALAYLFHMDVQTGIPFWLTVAASVAVYLVFFPALLTMRRCPRCVTVVAVVLIDASVWVGISVYAFLTGRESGVYDEVLSWTFISDAAVAVLL